MNRRNRRLATIPPDRATPLLFVPPQASGIGKGLPLLSERCCRFGGSTDLSRLRSGSPNKVRAEGPFDRIGILRNAPSSKDTVRAIRSVVAHELALMEIRAS